MSRFNQIYGEFNEPFESSSIKRALPHDLLLAEQPNADRQILVALTKAVIEACAKLTPSKNVDFTKIFSWAGVFEGRFKPERWPKDLRKQILGLL